MREALEEGEKSGESELDMADIRKQAKLELLRERLAKGAAELDAGQGIDGEEFFKTLLAPENSNGS